MKAPVLLLLMALCFFQVTSFWAQPDSLLHVSLLQADNDAPFLQNSRIRATPDGGSLQTGTRRSGEFSRAVVVKFNAENEIEWSFRLNMSLTGGNSWQVSYGVDALPLNDGSYALLAAVNQFLSNAEGLQNLDMALIRFSPPGMDGNAVIESAQTFGGTFADVPQQLERTKDGGFVIIGISNTEQALNLPSKAHTYLVKLNAAGELSWDFRLGAGNCETGAFALTEGMLTRPLCLTQDDAMVFTTHCNEFTYISKIDQAGQVLWTRRFDTGGSLFDGAYNEDWNAVLGAGAGSGGTIVQIRELPDGKLAFLGNQLSFFFFLFGNEIGLDGNGAALPMSYCFITDAEGNFLHGNAFFRETFGQPNFPIEMLAHDMIPLANGNLLISAGIQQYTTGGVTFVRPALVELNPQAGDFDEAVISALAVSDDERFKITDYPWGLDRIQLYRHHDSGRLGLSYDHERLSIPSVEDLTPSNDCLEQVPISQLRSLPISLDLLEGTLSMNSLSSSVAPATRSLTPQTPELMIACTELVSSIELPSSAELPPVIVAPTVSRGQVRLLVNDPRWLGAEVSILSPTGQAHHRYRLAAERSVFSTLNLPAGLYYLLIRKDDQQLVLKTVVSAQ